MDILLRVLALRLGSSVTIRAFADDVGIVLTDAPSQMPVLAAALEEFGLISGMEINIPKCVGIPLWEEELDTARAELDTVVPSWQGMPLRRSAVYLG